MNDKNKNIEWARATLDDESYEHLNTISHALLLYLSITKVKYKSLYSKQALYTNMGNALPQTFHAFTFQENKFT